MPEGKRRIHKDMNIGDVLDRYPEAQKVFRKHFGEGLLSLSRLQDGIDFFRGFDAPEGR